MDCVLTKRLGILVRVAHKVRDAYEELARREACWPENLCGLCMRASVQLFWAAKYFGIEMQIIGGVGHCYTMCDGYIVDVTATQFGEIERVLVVSPNEVDTYHSRCCWKKDRICTSVDDAYSGIWDESKVFDKDRLFVLKYLEPLMKEEMAWLGNESAVCM